MGAIINSVGIYSPERILTNQNLEKILKASGRETSNDWIIKRTGIRKRRIAAEHESTETMAVEAAKNALEKLQTEIPPVEHIIIATNTSERKFPNVAGFVRGELDKSHPHMIKPLTAGTDCYGGCGGINLALMQADALTKAGFYKTILVIGTEKLSDVTDYSDRGTCILFGDGASAYILTQNEGRRGFLGHMSRGFGDKRELITCEENQIKVTFAEAVRAVEEKRSPIKSRGRVLRMNGKAVYGFVVKEWRELIEKFSENERLNPDGVSFTNINAISPHLANLRMLESINETYPGFLEKCNLKNRENEWFCNTSTASQGRRDQNFLETSSSGEYLLKFGQGAGLVSCANFYQNP